MPCLSHCSDNLNVLNSLVTVLSQAKCCGLIGQQFRSADNTITILLPELHGLRIIHLNSRKDCHYLCIFPNLILNRLDNRLPYPLFPKRYSNHEKGKEGNMRISFKVAGDIINNSDHFFIRCVNTTENATFASRNLDIL